MSAAPSLKSLYRVRNNGTPMTVLVDSESLERHALAATLDNLAIGVVVVTDENRILHANRAAAQMFASGRPVCSVNGRLSTRDATAIAQLAKAVALALHGDSEIDGTGISVALGRAFGEPSIAQVLPLAHAHPAASVTAPGMVAVFIVPAVGPPIVNLAAVASCLGLTPSEARLVEKLAAGATLAEAAVALGIADTTAKTHLTHIFCKTGVSRQVELIALIHRLVPPVQKAAAA